MTKKKHYSKLEEMVNYITNRKEGLKSRPTERGNEEMRENW
jgi:hypothetical protein